MKNIYREDNTFVIEKNGIPYHVTKDMEEYEELSSQYKINPEAFSKEDKPEIIESISETSLDYFFKTN